MPRIALVTDSTANLSDEWASQRHVHVIPVYIRFGDDTYRDGVDMDSATFYRRLRTSPTLPKTSQPSVGDFAGLYERLLGDADAIVSVHLSARLSGTVAAAEAAKVQLTPASGTPPPIHVFDSRLASVGTGLLVSVAADAFDAGETVETALANMERALERMFLGFVPDTLEYLQKGGRIGRAAAMAGSLLQLRPILYFRDGVVDVRERQRTTKRARERLLEMALEAGEGGRVHVGICHADAPEEAERFRQRITAGLDCREVIVAEFTPVLGTYGGPGVVGVALYRE